MANLRFLLLLYCLLMLHCPIKSQNCSFGMFTDAHYAEREDSGNRKYSQSLLKIRQCIDTLNNKHVDFLIELGDLKDMPINKDVHSTLKYLQVVEQVIAGFKGERYHVLGNHDEDCISKKQFQSAVKNSHISKNRSYYSFYKNGFQFIVLDACFDSLGNNYDNGNFKWYDSNIPPMEIRWLTHELKKSRMPVIIFVHQLLYGTTNVTIRNAPQIRKILENSGRVKYVFHGHEHIGGEDLINDIHYYTLPGMVEGDFPEHTSFAVVSISRNELVIKGFGSANSKTLKYDK